jgi:nitroimidazol reductase NimA-like FMN-containing flavoprotein (pyridoxamine 5'-phosphate oxidase superfamily)
MFIDLMTQRPPCHDRSMSSDQAAFSETAGTDPGPSTDRVRLRRLAREGSHRREDLHAVLDAGFICHLGVSVDGAPMVVPTIYARTGDHLVIHGSVASRSLRQAKAGLEVCVTVTHVDGLIVARSVFEHSVAYRCAMVFGTADVVDEPGAKEEALRVIADHSVPGTWGYARTPSEAELAKTMVLRLALDEFSVKISEGPPGDGDGPDAALDVWAGVLPLSVHRGSPVPDPALRPGIMLPPHLGG